MSKFIFDENHSRFDIGEALTITKGVWSDGNPRKQNRIGLFVTSGNDENEVEIASEGSYICGVTVRNDPFLGLDADDPKYCVVQSLGLCVVKDDGTLQKGDKCMPSNGGIAIVSLNELGFRVVERVDANHVKIIVSPNNDMIQRIKRTTVQKSKYITDDDFEDIIAGTYIDDDDDYDGVVEQYPSIGEKITNLEINDEHLDARVGVLEEDVDELKEDTTQLFESIAEIRDNAFDVDTSRNILNGHWNDGYMNINGIVAGIGTYVHTDPIPTKGNTNLIVTANNPNDLTIRNNFPIRFVTAFDENNIVLPTKGLQNAGGSGSVVSGVSIINIDASVKYIVLTFNASVIREDLQAMASFDTTATEYEEYGKVDYTLKEECLPPIYQADYSMSAVLDRYLNGKTIAIFGDSIMRGTGNNNIGVGDLLATKYNMISVNKAHNGACMGIRDDKVERVFHIAYQIEGFPSDVTPDIVIFDGATNDMGGITTNPLCVLGEMTTVYTEPTSETDFSKGFERACYLLRTKFPNAILIYIRVHNMASRLYDRQKAYGERGIEIAEKWGINVIDVYKKMNTQLNGGTSEYLEDYTHPNELGYNTFYIPALEKWLYENRPSEF